MPLALQSVCRCKPLSCKLQAMASAASSYEHTGSQAHVYRSSALSVTRASPSFYELSDETAMGAVFVLR